MVAGREKPSAISADIQVRASGEEEVFFEGYLLVLAPDKIRVDIFSPFGTLNLIVVADGTKIAVAIPSEQALYRGDASRTRMAKLLFLPLMPNEVAGVLLGAPALLQKDMTLVECLTEKGNEEKGDIGFVFSRGGEPRRMWMDKSGRLVGYGGEGAGEPFFITFHYQGDLLVKIILKHKESVANIEFVSRKEEQSLPIELFNLTPAKETRIVDMF